MNLYVESSAILSWLLAQARAKEIQKTLADAELVLSSDLALLECERVLVRGIAAGQASESDTADRQILLRQAAEHWLLLGFDTSVIERAQRPFPDEPVRTLDALHLSFALAARSLVAGIRFLSLDGRLRKTARAMGLAVVPEAD
jgi:predicted RNA-binding Zn ribbon-like protein